MSPFMSIRAIFLYLTKKVTSCIVHVVPYLIRVNKANISHLVNIGRYLLCNYTRLYIWTKPVDESITTIWSLLYLFYEFLLYNHERHYIWTKFLNQPCDLYLSFRCHLVILGKGGGPCVMTFGSTVTFMLNSRIWPFSTILTYLTLSTS